MSKDDSSKNIPAQIHDKVYRGYMADPRAVEEFITEYLPVEYLKRIDLSTLKLENTNFIELNLQKQSADILYSVQINDRKGYFYMLFEHQSTSERFMLLRLKRYELSIINYHLKQETDFQKGQKRYIPTIIPAVYYSGHRPYTAPLNWYDLYHPEDRALNQSLAFEPHALVDLHRTSDKIFEKQAYLGYLSWMMKHIDDKTAYDILNMSVCFQCLSDEQLEITLQYVSKIKHIDDLECLLERTSGLNPEARYKMTDITEKLYQRGLGKGVAQGIEKGIEKGIEENKRKTAVNMLKKGLDIELIAECADLTKEEVLQLRSEHVSN